MVNPHAAPPVDPGQSALAAGLPHAAHRAGVVFLLDMINISRNGRHPIDALLLAVIVQANVSTIGARADWQIDFAAIETPPPDELRRPISINALASSLRLPFESVRRRVHGLARQGLCQISRAGVIVPTAILTHPEYIAQAFKAYERLRLFHGELRGMGALEGLPPASVDLAGGLVPVRTVARILSDHLLRVMDVAHAAFGDLIACLLLLETFCANTEHLPPVGEPAPGEGPIRVYADELRRPLRAAALARRSGFATETVRRQANALIRRGLLLGTPKGLIVPSAVLAGPDVLRFLLENAVQIRRMFAQLSQLGVLAVWDDYAQAQAASA